MMDSREVKLRLSKIKPGLMERLNPYSSVELTIDIYIRLTRLVVTYIKMSDPIILCYVYPSFSNRNDKLYLTFEGLH